MPGLIDEVFVRVRPLVAGFAEETTAGIRGALATVNAQVADSAKQGITAATAEIDANKAVAGSYLGIADAAQAPLRSIEEIKAAVADQQATVASVARANVDALVAERDANLQLAASYETIANAAVQGSERQIAASKLAAEAAVRAGVEIKAAAEGEAAAFAGVKTRLLSMGNILGIGFGAAIGVHIVKNVVDSAAQLQKSVEAIHARFGVAGDAVARFGDTAAAKLGISADLADATAARFGILFSTLGFGQTQAAQMTLGFEKLAGSISAIKGVDPTTVMQNIVLAAAGNTRGLKQLGIVVDTTSEKQALFGAKAALMTAALTPAQKTLAIYRIATQQLGVDQAAVAAHAGDLANKQRELSAEFSNAKDELGQALLPIFAKYTTELADWLGRMERSGKLQHDFNSIAATAKGVIDGVVGALKTAVGIWSGFTGAVGGAKNAILILLGVMAVSKFASIGGAVLELGGTIAGIGRAAMGAARAFGIATGIIDAQSVATAATVDAAIVSTGIGAIIVAIGVMTAIIITHWDNVKRNSVALGEVMVQIWRGVADAFIGYNQWIAGSIVKYLIFPLKEFIDLQDKAVGFIPYLGQGVSDAAKAADALYNSVSKFASGGADRLRRGIGDLAPGSIAKTWSDALSQAANSPGTKDAATKAGASMGDAVTNGLAGATQNLTKPLKPVLDALHNAIQAAQTKIHQTVMDAKNNLVKIGDDLAKTIEQIQAKIGGAVGAIAGSPQGQAFAKLKKLIEAGAPSFEIARAQAELSSQLKGVGKQQPQIKTELDNLTAAFNKGQITYGQFQERLHKILREDGITMSQALKAGGSAFADTFKAQVSALGQQAKAISEIPAKFRGIGGAGGAADIKIVRPLQVIQQEQAKIGQAAQRQRDQQIRYAREMAKYQANLLEQVKQEHHARVAAARTRTHHLEQINGPPGPHGPIGGPSSDANGPLGPNGPIGAPLEHIRVGILHQTAVASTERKQQVTHLQTIAGEIGRLGHEFAVADETHIARPLDVLHQDNIRMGAVAEKQRGEILKATQKTNAELRALRRYTPVPGFDKYPHGKGSKDARAGAKVGSRS